MYFETTYSGVKFEIDYAVDSDGEYCKFDVYVGDQCMNHVLDKEVISTLEATAWDKGYIPDCKEWNDDLKIERHLSSMEA